MRDHYSTVISIIFCILEINVLHLDVYSFKGLLWKVASTKLSTLLNAIYICIN